MNLTVDHVLIGTGLAPLIAAKRLMQQGYEVALLNPDHDFFIEESELPFDPLIPFADARFPDAERFRRSLFSQMVEVLGPEYPGALEQWPQREGGFHDPLAAHIHDRHRLWVPSDPASAQLFERIFVESMDKDFQARVVDGVAALRRFPGYSAKGGTHEVSGILASRLGDVDVSRYRRGFLEFVRSKLSPAQVCLRTRDIEISKSGVRVALPQGVVNWLPRHSVLFFQTPRLTSGFEKRLGLVSKDQGLRLWEEWSLSTREAILLDGIGIFGNLAVWSDPESEGRVLRVLRGGYFSTKRGRAESALSAEALKELSFLFESFLRWEHFSIRRYRYRWISEYVRENESISREDGGERRRGSEGRRVGESEDEPNRQTFWDTTDFRSQKIFRLYRADGPIHEIVYHVSMFLEGVLK